MLRSPENPRPHSKTETEEQADAEAPATEEPVLAQGGELSAEEFSGEKYSNYFFCCRKCFDDNLVFFQTLGILAKNLF